MEQVGHHQERFGRVQQGRFAQLHGQQLEQRIELQELQARMAEDLLSGNQLEGPPGHIVGPSVAIMERIAQQFVAPPEQSEVDAPGIDADAGHGITQLVAGRS